MPNTKSVGVAFSDPVLDGAVIDNSAIGGTTPAAGSFTTVQGDSGYTSTSTTGAVASNASGGFYFLTTAITANSTTTTAPAGSFGVTSNATGIGKLFYSDGTKWQFGAIA